MKFDWNEIISSVRCIWDPTGEGEEKYVTELKSLKERLYSPGQVRTADHLADMSIGIAMIMDHLERKENDKV